MFTAQAEGCAPIVRAWETGTDAAEPWPDARTYAAGLRVPSAVGDFLMLRALRASGGGAVAVSDGAMAQWVRELGAATGVFASPEGAAAAAAVPLLLRRGMLSGAAEIVLFNTGSGLKYVGAYPLV
jgi:threonine synthase